MIIGCAPDHIKKLSNNMKGQHKKYGSKNHISETIYSVIGYMIASIATDVSWHDQNYPNWDKGLIYEIIIIPKVPKNKIFVGGK